MHEGNSEAVISDCSRMLFIPSMPRGRSISGNPSCACMQTISVPATTDPAGSMIDVDVYVPEKGKITADLLVLRAGSTPGLAGTGKQIS